MSDQEKIVLGILIEVFFIASIIIIFWKATKEK